MITKEKFAKYMNDIVEAWKHLNALVDVLEISECVMDYDIQIPVDILVDELEPYREDPLIFQAVVNKCNDYEGPVKDDNGEPVRFNNWEELYDILVKTKEEKEKEN